MKHPKMMVAALSLSSAGLVGILLSEDFTGHAIIPTKNDRPTVGFGSTFKEDGTPVKLGDTIAPPKAVKLALTHIQKDELNLKQCVKGDMSQAEWDILVDFAYQYGTSRTCSSSIVRNINLGNYVSSCNAYTLYKFSGGYDCSIPGNKICFGVWKRNLERRDKCLEAQ
jgi:lysozyme